MPILAITARKLKELTKYAPLHHFTLVSFLLETIETKALPMVPTLPMVHTIALAIMLLAKM